MASASKSASAAETAMLFEEQEISTLTASNCLVRTGNDAHKPRDPGVIKIVEHYWHLLEKSTLVKEPTGFPVTVLNGRGTLPQEVRC